MIAVFILHRGGSQETANHVERQGDGTNYVCIATAFFSVILVSAVCCFDISTILHISKVLLRMRIPVLVSTQRGLEIFVSCVGMHDD